MDDDDVTEVALIRSLSGAAPMDIVDRVFEAPFTLDVHIDGAEVAALTQRIKTSSGERLVLDLGDIGGAAVVNRVTPEQLLAVVATIIATAPDAATACARLRTEVSGWTFQGADGVIR